MISDRLKELKYDNNISGNPYRINELLKFESKLLQKKQKGYSRRNFNKFKILNLKKW